MKNKTMRVAALLLALTLMTSCFVGGTFAKYTVAGTSTESARVAKFGVIVNGSNDIFKQWYPTHDTDLTSAESAIIGANSVVSSNADNMLAPGTNGSLANFTLEGTPEVAVRVTYALTDFDFAGWTTDGSDTYFPIIFTVNGVDYKIGAAEPVNNFMARVAAAIAARTEVYAANTNLATDYNTDLAVSWRWEFDGEATGAALSGYQTNAKDTVLGDAGTATFSMTITCTVEQVD